MELRCTEIFRAAAVGLGSLGIIYSVTFRCVPVYNIEEERKVVSVPWPGGHGFRVRHRFEPMFSNVAEGEFFSFFVNPYPQPRR